MEGAVASNQRFVNPPSLSKPPGYSHVVEVAAPGRTIYVAGQLGFDTAGNLVGAPGDFGAQAEQAFANLKAALGAVGARIEHVVKTNYYLVDIEKNVAILREVRDRHINTAAPPASTAVGVTALARPGALFELEAVAVVPA
jgi:enamine deaminase RidA (YjgF/YER057c/UK114 family)